MSFFYINGLRYTTQEDLDLDITEPEIRELGNIPEEADIFLRPRAEDQKEKLVPREGLQSVVFLGTINNLECSFVSRVKEDDNG